MHSVVKQNVGVDIILARAHIDMVFGDLRELLHNSLSADAHKLGRNCGANEDLGHPAQLANELLCALINRLCTVKLGVVEVGVDAVYSRSDLAPSVLLVERHWRIEFVLFVCKADGVARAFHQKIVYVKRGGKSVFSFHYRLSFFTLG